MKRNLALRRAKLPGNRRRRNSQLFWYCQDGFGDVHRRPSRGDVGLRQHDIRKQRLQLFGEWVLFCHWLNGFQSA